MTYFVIEKKNGDLFDEVVETREEAIEKAKATWNHLLPVEKKRTIVEAGVSEEEIEK